VLHVFLLPLKFHNTMLASFGQEVSLGENQQNPLWNLLKALWLSPSTYLKVVNLNVLKLELPAPLYHREALWNDENEDFSGPNKLPTRSVFDLKLALSSNYQTRVCCCFITTTCSVTPLLFRYGYIGHIGALACSFVTGC